MHASAVDDLHLVHIGVEPFPFAERMPGRYHWHASLPAPDFRTVLSSSDLLLSLNASATTNTLAAVSGVPVLVLQNGFDGPAADLPTFLGRAPTPAVAAWAERHLPIYRFLMWPMSMWGALTPVLADNPYDRLLHRTEILDGARVREQLNTLLFDVAARERAAQARARYVDSVSGLPQGHELLLQHLGIG
jgi:hypothetical protein